MPRAFGENVKWNANHDGHLNLRALGVYYGDVGNASIR